MGYKNFSIAVMVISVVLVVTTLLMGCAQQKPSAPVQSGPIAINVGIVNDITGPVAPWGMGGLPYYKAWLDLFNKKGFQVGDKTYIFNQIYEDGQSAPEPTAAAAKKLVYGENCKFIIGYFFVWHSQIAAVTTPAKAIFMCRTGTEFNYEPQKEPYTVFATAQVEQWAAAIMTLAETNPKYKKIGILESTLAKKNADYINPYLDQAGVRYVWEYYPYPTTDYVPYLTRLAEDGCDIVYSPSDIGASFAIAKLRWEMGYKNWIVGHGGSMVHPAIYDQAVGHEAAQGIVSDEYYSPDFKKTDVNPEFIQQCKDAESIVKQTDKDPFVYKGWTSWAPVHYQILAQAMQKAGSVDDTDAIMKAIRGGTFDTNVGKITMCGEKTYGSPVVAPCPGAVCHMVGNSLEYLGEHPIKFIP